MKQWPLCFAAAGFLSLSIRAFPAEQGESVFQRRCSGCHQLDAVRSGPRLRGVFGRKAGSDPGFPYSAALKSSQLTWNEDTLDRWLSDPEAVAPNNDMPFRLSRTDERRAIILYLKTL